MAFYSPDVGQVLYYDLIQFLCLGLSLFSIIFITVYNYIRGEYIFQSYEQMVKRDLDKAFEKFNKPGLEWYSVPGHYWLELRIEPIVKEKSKPLFSEENMPPGPAFNKNPKFQNMIKSNSTKPNLFSNPDSSNLNNSKLRPNNNSNTSQQKVSANSHNSKQSFGSDNRVMNF